MSNKFPLTELDKFLWTKKINSTSMYTVPAEEEALPILIEIEEILRRIVTLPLEDTLPLEYADFFFCNICGVICQKIIKARFFKNQRVLSVADNILQMTLKLVPLYLHLLDRIPQLPELLTSVFPHDDFYKSNSLLTYRSVPFDYFTMKPTTFGYGLKQGDKVDIVKFSSTGDKLEWTQGMVVSKDEEHSQFVEIQYLFDVRHSRTTLHKSTHLLAPFQSKSKLKMEWRKQLKVGCLVDCEDSFGGWYNGTVSNINGENEHATVEVQLKVYHENGPKTDQNGKFYGFMEYFEVYEIGNVKLQPYCSVAKEFVYESSKTSLDYVDDLNDMEIKEINGETVFAIPRKRHLSSTVFKSLTEFGKSGGFTKIIDLLEGQKPQVLLLAHYLKSMSVVGAYIHKDVLTSMLERLKKVAERTIFIEDEEVVKQYTKERSQMIFGGIKALQKRIYSIDKNYEYENRLKMRLVQKCLNGTSLKRKLQGLSELKQIVKSLTFSSSRNVLILQWMRNENIFQKIYFVDSHVQLIKKSESFFRYCINEGLLQLEDLHRLLKMAQKGDCETRISIYFLFQEVIHILKKPQVEYLIDKVLECPLPSVLLEDIELMYQLSRNSSFPMDKIMSFFQQLILSNSPEIAAQATKKYADIIAKNYDMRTHRKEIIKGLFLKLKSDPFARVSNVLKQIFQGIAIGEIGKQELAEILLYYDIDAIFIEVIEQRVPQEHTEQSKTLTVDVMQFLKSIYTLCPKVKIQVKTLKALRKVSEGKAFVKWFEEVLKCEQGLDKQDEAEVDQFFNVLFSEELLRKLQPDDFQMFRQVLIEVNQLLKEVNMYSSSVKFTPSVNYHTSITYPVEKELRRRVRLLDLKYFSQLQFIIDFAESSIISDKATELYSILLTAGGNSSEQIITLFNRKWAKLVELSADPETNQRAICRTLRVIDILIDESEKQCSEKIKSLGLRRKDWPLKVSILNQTKYYGDSIKKVEVTASLNLSLSQFKKKLAKELDVPYDEIRIAHKKEFTELQNCRTLKELGFNHMDMYTVSRRITNSNTEAPLVCNNAFTPRALRVLKTIFQQYSVNGKMDQPNCRSFTAKCLGPVSERIVDSRVDTIFKQYNQDKFGFLTFENFSDFYLEHSIARPEIVWLNLKNLGVHNDLRLKNEEEIKMSAEELPRKAMAEQGQTYEILFRLLKCEQTSQAAFALLERLPVSKKLEEEMLGVDKDELELQRLLRLQDKLQFFYRLNIVEYLSECGEDSSETEKEWILRFISEKGYQKLLELLCRCMSEPEYARYREITDLLISLLNDFLLSCFCTPESLSCWALLNDPSDIDDKLQYLVTGKFASPRTLVVPQKEMVYQFSVMGRVEISQHLVRFLTSLWLEEGTTPLKETLITKCLNFIGFLLVNQDPRCLVEKLGVLIEKAKGVRELKRLYSVIMCYCFYSSKWQLEFIRELFSCLSLSNVISEHFGVLAVLVNKFGLSQINEEQTKAVLMDSIFNNSLELTIEGCARLLCNFNLSQSTEDEYIRLWKSCVLDEKKCVKDSTKQAVYELLLKMSESSASLVEVAQREAEKTLSQCFANMRISSCVELNQRAPCGYVGLKNLGSICYINSMMQQLFTNQAFRYLIQRINDGRPEEWVETNGRRVDDNILHQLQNIFGYLEHSSRMDYIPYGFCVAYKPFGAPVNVMIQQDVQEFISMFFDQLNTRIKGTALRGVVDAFYGGEVCNLFNCHDCHQTKKVVEPFYSITLEVKNSKSLAGSCAQFIQGEVINDYKCDFCNNRADVSKSTRISKCPKILIIHLQRIVFNLDTFINEKITTKHEFPMIFNLGPYTLDAYEQRSVDVEYVLIGIICHIGNAQSGHYISYIKKAEGKWLQFNDSLVNTFDITRMDAECFGGSTSFSSAGASTSTHFIEDYEWDKGSESAKSAYILLYEKKGSSNLNLILNALEEKDVLLKELQLKQFQDLQQHIIDTVQNKQPTHFNQIPDQQHMSSKEQDQPASPIYEGPTSKGQPPSPTEISQDVSPNKKPEEAKDIRVLLDEQVEPYIQSKLKGEIDADNKVHSFEKIIASPHFALFFAKIFRNESSIREEILPILKKVTFGFWMKSSSFAQLLRTNIYFIESKKESIDELLLSNDSFLNLLLQVSDAEVRGKVARFAVNALEVVFKQEGFSLDGESALEKKVKAFLERLIQLLPNLVSKCWTRFSQYFEFWRDFARSGTKQCKYMLDRDYIKHFVDYFLDKKSPLGIYSKRLHEVGTKFASPNFTMLLSTVSELLNALMVHQMALTPEDLELLMHYETLDKLLGENNEGLATRLVGQICRNNLHASQRVAIVLLKTLYKATFLYVQPYLNIIEEYLLIDDGHQRLRILWIIGKQTISLSFKAISYFNSYNQDERIHNFHSTLAIDQTNSLLEVIYENNRRAENLCMMSIKALLKICLKSKTIDDYVLKLESPVVCFSKYMDFIDSFIKAFTEEAKRTYYYTTGTNKEELAKEVKEVYTQLKLKRKVLITQENKISDAASPIIEMGSKTSPKKDEDDQIVYEPTYMPVKFKYIQKESYEDQGLVISLHESSVSYLLLKPNGRSNNSLRPNNAEKNIDRVQEDTWKTEQVRVVRGFYVNNPTGDLLRVKTEEGTSQIRTGEWQFIWAEKIERVFAVDRISEWPKWSLYSHEK